MKNNVFHELAWFKARETLKPMPKWYHASKISLFVGFPTVLAILILLPFLVPFLGKAEYTPSLMGGCAIVSVLFLWVYMIAYFFDKSSYFNWVYKYKNEYLELKASYPSYTERDFYLKVKSSLVKEWEEEKEKIRKHQLEKSNAIKNKYDL